MEGQRVEKIVEKYRSKNLIFYNCYDKIETKVIVKESRRILNKISYEKHINTSKGSRIEFWITNFDYFDGIDYLAKQFCKKYQMQADKKVEGIFFDFITLHADNVEYILMWHEDIGTLVYSLNQDQCHTTQLEAQLSAIIQKINSCLIK